MIRLACALAAVIGAVLAFGLSPAATQSNAPYCAVSRGADMIYESCNFPSFEACLAEIRSLGGYCRPNSYFVPPPIARDRAYDRRQSQPR